MGGGADGLREKFLEVVLAARFIRTLVSKKRRRFIMGSFDLDMSYITDRLVAMSFPSQHIRAVYRNPLWQVKRVLDTKHGSHYKVYNLCAEETYDPEYFDGRVEAIPFDDNHVPPLSLIKIFCESVHAWLSSDAQNVAVVHCMVVTKVQQTLLNFEASIDERKGIQRFPKLNCLIPVKYLRNFDLEDYRFSNFAVFLGLLLEHYLQVNILKRTH